MISLGVVLLQVLSCLGLGASLLRALGVSAEMRGDELLAWGFALGFGLLGWILFFVGVAGLFMETHPDPDQALSDGPNAWPLAGMRALLETLVEIDRTVKQHDYQEDQ